MKKPPARILVVEDEGVIALDLQQTLQRLGYSVPAVVGRGREAIEQACELHPDLVLMDIRLRDDVDGVEAAQEIRKRIDVPVVYLTAYADPSTLQRARVTEPDGYLLKPFEERELQVTVELALYRHEIARKLRESERWLTATLRSIAESVIATDADWNIRFMNPSACRLTGWTSVEATGRNVGDVLRVSMPLAPRNLDPGEPHSGGGAIEGVLVTRSGEEVLIEERSTLIRDDHGKVAGIVIAIRERASQP